MAQFDEGSVWQFGPPSLNQAQLVQLTAMVHIQSRSYDRMMYDQLLWEMTDGDVREAQFCWGFSVTVWSASIELKSTGSGHLRLRSTFIMIIMTAWCTISCWWKWQTMMSRLSCSEMTLWSEVGHGLQSSILHSVEKFSVRCFFCSGV